MTEVIQTTIDIYKNYIGNSMMAVLLMAAVLYLWVTEEKKEIKILFVYLTAAVGALFFFPVFAYIAMHVFLDKQVYYRIIWLLPMGMIVSYTFVKVVTQIERKRRRIVVSVFALLFLIQTGSLIYLNPMVTPRENLYHLPAEDIAVADVLHVDGRNVKAVVPAELLQFIRQYDPSIELAYGREALVDGWSSNPLFECMEANPVRSYAITDYSRQQGVEYIVLRTGTPIVGGNPIQKYQFTYLTTVENYDIYIFDDAEFAEEKKAEYASLMDEDWEENWTNTH